MAENITGIESSTCGGSSHEILPSAPRSMCAGFFPNETRVSMGSRSGSIGGFVTCDALMSRRSQYTGSGRGLPMDESSTPPVAACL